MNYKNIVFDFGNVLGKFDGIALLKQFCSDENDLQLLSDAILPKWDALDNGSIDYDQNIEDTIAILPGHLEPIVRKFFREWPDHLTPLTQTLDFILELKERNVPIYLLSNAPTYFAEWAKGYDFLKNFDGIVFSAPLKIAKPEPDIYQYLFHTYSLDPKECFFIDDLERNIEGARKLGMDGIIFTGNIEDVKKAINF